MAEQLTDAVLRQRGIDPEQYQRLRSRAAREIDEGLLPAAQIALAREGELLATESFGGATEESLFCIFSATKAVTSGAIWLLLQEGKLELQERVVDIIPDFATNGKDAVLVEHLLTHTAGFPHAPFRPLDWNDPERRAQRFAQWRLQWPPGTQFEYHPSSSMWVLAEIIERRSGSDYREFVRQRVLDPLGLSDFYVGLIPDAVQTRVLPCVHSGAPMTDADYVAAGLPVPPESEVTEDAILSFNEPAVRNVGVPGGGGVTSAAALALYHQALLHGGRNGNSLWQPDMLAAARRVHSGELADPMFRKRANRGLGLIIAGDEDRTYRGFGKTNSSRAFGHNGAGGQIAWVDPDSGLSFAYVTSGHDRNSVRQARRGVALSSIAAGCSLQ
ncbi:MAG: serine hydrolase domain-containing protein [Pseudomonadales bacterium]